jgi:hypothetical protein
MKLHGVISLLAITALAAATSHGVTKRQQENNAGTVLDSIGSAILQFNDKLRTYDQRYNLDAGDLLAVIKNGKSV